MTHVNLKHNLSSSALAIVSSTPGGPGAAPLVGVGPLVAAAVVVRLAALVARHRVPPEGPVANIPSPAGPGQLPPRAVRLHHQLLVQLQDIGHHPVAIGFRDNPRVHHGEVVGTRHHGHGGERNQQDEQRQSESHRH